MQFSSTVSRVAVATRVVDFVVVVPQAVVVAELGATAVVELQVLPVAVTLVELRAVGIEFRLILLNQTV